MTIKPVIRRSVDSGAYVYGIVESYTLGVATVRLAHGGARLTCIPVTFSPRAGDTIIVDYTLAVPSVRRNSTPATGTRVRPLRRARPVVRTSNAASFVIPEP